MEIYKNDCRAKIELKKKKRVYYISPLNSV